MSSIYHEIKKEIGITAEFIESILLTQKEHHDAFSLLALLYPNLNSIVNHDTLLGFLAEIRNNLINKNFKIYEFGNYNCFSIDKEFNKNLPVLYLIGNDKINNK